MKKGNRNVSEPDPAVREQSEAPIRSGFHQRRGLSSFKRISEVATCVICGGPTKVQKWAIRDYTGTETYFRWILRHVKYLLMRGFRKYQAFQLPLCGVCVHVLAENHLKGGERYIKRPR